MQATCQRHWTVSTPNEKNGWQILVVQLHDDLECALESLGCEETLDTSTWSFFVQGESV